MSNSTLRSVDSICLFYSYFVYRMLKLLIPHIFYSSQIKDASPRHILFMKIRLLIYAYSADRSPKLLVRRIVAGSGGDISCIRSDS